MELYKREKYLSRIRPFYDAEDLIKVITGVRRCGKSSIMQMIYDELVNAGVPETNLIYIDLDKRGYRNIRTDQQLETLIDSKTPESGTVYLFIDEIQNVKNFETLINGYRNDGRFSIFITGSNSYLLSGELVTKQVPVYRTIEVTDKSSINKPLYGTVCYKSTKTRKITQQGSTQTKWSYYNNKTLLNNGWSYTGNKRAA